MKTTRLKKLLLILAIIWVYPLMILAAALFINFFTIFWLIIELHLGCDMKYDYYEYNHSNYFIAIKQYNKNYISLFYFEYETHKYWAVGPLFSNTIPISRYVSSYNNMISSTSSQEVKQIQQKEFYDVILDEIKTNYKPLRIEFN